MNMTTPGVGSASDRHETDFRSRVLALLLALTAAGHLAAQDDVPRILLDQPVVAVEYQLGRLSNAQLVKVERQPDVARYRPVYDALLRRKGLAREYRDEAIAALTKLDRASQTEVLLGALAKAPADDPQAAAHLLRLLLDQPAEALISERSALTKAIDAGSPAPVLRGAYGALMIAAGQPDPAWQIASQHDGHLKELLRSVPYVSATAFSGSSSPTARSELSAHLFAPIAALLGDTRDVSMRAAAIAALGWTRRDAATFGLIGREILDPAADGGVKEEAIRSLQLIPESAWPRDQILPLAHAIVSLVSATPPDRRAEPSTVDALQLGETLSAALPDETKRTVRRDLRALGVHVVRIDTVPEQMKFDVNWFAVEAGSQVQMVLHNSDAMPHNLVIGQPKAVQEVGTAAAAVAVSADPDAKPYVPASPLVLHATNLVTEGESARLSFTAPKAPGEYVFLCTFPGHWVRMYGVMLVVDGLDAWEAHPIPPHDPITNQPFASQRK
jgi:azurin